MCGKSITIHSTYISQIMYTQKLINWWGYYVTKKSKASTLDTRNICTSLNRRFHFVFFLLVFEKLIFILENVDDMVEQSIYCK